MTSKEHYTADGIQLHTDPADFEGMRKAGALAAEILDMIGPHVVPGISTEALDTLCHDYASARGAVPAPLGYGEGPGRPPFPKATCTSVNHVVCHGIPAADKILKEGDIVNIDVTVIVDGWHGDTSRMFLVGNKISVKAKRLVEVTYDAMMRGIEAVKPGATLGDVGYAIQSYAEGERFGVVTDFCGHGLGQVFHCPPSVMHVGRPGQGTVLEPGMFFTIEPMINAGDPQTKVIARNKDGSLDGWTAVTRDKSLSAQFEHSLAVTDDGFEIFTLSPKGYTKPPYDS